MDVPVSSTQLLLGLAIGVILLIFISMKTKLHTFVALIISAIVTGLIGGLPYQQVMDSVTVGFGNTLSSTGIIIGLGVILGAVLEMSGAAEQMAFSMIKLVGKGKEEWALALTGYIVAIPVFSDSGLVILTPLAKSISRMTGKSAVGLGLALATGLQLTHVFVPPTPGPLAVAGILGVDIGMMIMAGILFSIPTLIASVYYSKWLGKKIYQIPTEDGLDFVRMDYKEEYEKSIDNIEEIYKEKKLPGAALSFSPVAIPLLLILSNTVIDLIGVGGSIQSITGFLGNPVISLIIGLLIAVYGLARRYTREQVIGSMDDGIKATGMILLVTGAGGSLGQVVRDAGIGDALGQMVLNIGLPGVLVPFIIAVLMRIALGSATVALITAATLTAPLVTQLGLNPVMLAMSTCAGAVSFSYFNDSGYWTFNGLYGLPEIKDQFWAKTMVSFIGAGVTLAGVLLANMFVG